MNKKIIRFASRQNLKYPLQYLLWNVLRDTEGTLMGYFLGVSDLSINLPLMFLGEFLAGLLIYFYQRQFLINYKERKTSRYMSIELIKTEETEDKLQKDSNIKIHILIFFAAFFDFIEFQTFACVFRFFKISWSIETRLRGFYTIFNALFYFFVLNLPILRHQKFSLIIIGICKTIIVVTEFLFQEISIFLTYGELILVFFFVFVIHFFSALVDSVGKYLYEYNQLNPFYELMFEGIFGFLISFLYCIFYNPFEEIIEFKKNNSNSNFIILIFLLFLYIFLSGGKNSYRVMTTKIFTPMTTTSVDYLINPLYLIYYFADGLDFLYYGEKNYPYFILNLVISFIISLCGLIYNEFLILNFCGLEIDTHYLITERSNKEIELNIFEEEDNDTVD